MLRVGWYYLQAALQECLKKSLKGLIFCDLAAKNNKKPRLLLSFFNVFWLLFFFNSFLSAAPVGLLLPEGLKDVSESFFDELIREGKFVDLWRDDPYREFNRRLAAAENFMELGLFEEAALQTSKAERALQVAWGIVRGRQGLSRNIPPLAEFQNLSRTQQKLWQEKLYQELRLSFQQEELSYLQEEAEVYRQRRERCRWWYEQLLRYGYQQQNVLTASERLMGLINQPETAYLQQLVRSEHDSSEIGRRIFRRLFYQLLAQGDKSAANLKLEQAIQRGKPAIRGLALARLLLLADRATESESLLRSIPLRPEANLSEYRIFFHSRMLLTRLLISQGRLAEASELLNLLEQERMSVTELLNPASEIKTYLAEQHYRLRLELAVLSPDLPLPAPEPAFSEISHNLYRHILALRSPQDKRALRLSAEDLLSPAELSEWKDSLTLAGKCQFSDSFPEAAAVFSERLLALLSLQPVNCPFAVWEKNLLQSKIDAPRVFYLLERRRLLEEAMAGRLPALSLPVQQALLRFRRSYLLGENNANLALLPTKYHPVCRDRANCLWVYQSENLLAYSSTNFSKKLALPLQRDITDFVQGIRTHGELYDFLTKNASVELELFYRAHEIPWESLAYPVWRKLPNDFGVCSLCTSTNKWRGLTIGKTIFSFGPPDDASADIIAAFREGDILPLDENTARRLAENLQKPDSRWLLHLPGEFQATSYGQNVWLRNSSLPLLNLYLLSQTGTARALVFPTTHNHEALWPLTHIAAGASAEFLIYSFSSAPVNFNRAFYYDLYSRLDRRSKPFPEALAESRNRAQKSLAESTWLRQMAVYVP